MSKWQRIVTVTLIFPLISMPFINSFFTKFHCSDAVSLKVLHQMHLTTTNNIIKNQQQKTTENKQQKQHLKTQNKQ
jgi:hypothetical protein